MTGKEDDMRSLDFEPLGKIYLSPAQRQARYIKKLENLVTILGGLCIGLAISTLMLAACLYYYI